MSVFEPAAGDTAATRAAQASIRVSALAHRRARLFALLGMDLLTTNAAFFLAYYLRYVVELGGDVPGESFVEFAVYAPVHALFLGLCLLGYQLRGSYTLPRGSSLAREVWFVFGSTATSAMVVFAAVSIIRYPASSRLLFVYAWILAVGLTILGRVLIRLVQARLYERGHGVERVIVVGNNRLARMVMQMLAQEKHLGYQVLGFVDNRARADFGRFRALGPVDQLPTLINHLQANHVVVALPAAQHAHVLWALDHCRRDGVSFSLVPDLFELRLSSVRLNTVSGIPLFGLNESNLVGWNLFMKRALDVVGSVMLLVILSPIFVVVAAAIRLESEGPVFFRQTRLGKGGVPFTCFKFRSMHVGADSQRDRLEALNEADGPIFKIRDDPRLTRVGRLVRRMSIDETPQLWNVLTGEMSLVGPRPPIPLEVERYEEWHRRRLETVPGITGLWQVSGRSELSFDEMVMLDLYYIENWSLVLDLQILARTVPAVFAGAGAF
ncbi:MAG: exopolysaccharide biosynthesis polyprenyl glycosylphosphotransferase [Chloroflexi bacterium]|nr:exopolysaccharide biosynthesis polyprenyl glycosylphosphotransferase [Chloroflexota bacterium]